MVGSHTPARACIMGSSSTVHQQDDPHSRSTCTIHMHDPHVLVQTSKHRDSDMQLPLRIYEYAMTPCVMTMYGILINHAASRGRWHVLGTRLCCSVDDHGVCLHA